MLVHAKVIWLIRTFLLRNQRHWTHQLCWSMQRWFEWSEHPLEALDSPAMLVQAKVIWLIRTSLLWKSEALDSPTMLVHAKVIWLIRTSLLRNQRHWTHQLCWSMQRWFDWSEHPSEALDSPAMLVQAKVIWLIRTSLLWKSETLDSPTTLVHAKVIWLIRTSLLRNQRHWTHLLCWSKQRWFDWSEHLFCGNQRHWTHPLCWSMQRWFDWSEHPFWEIRGTGLTSYVGPSKGDLTDQNIPSEESEALDSPPMLVQAKVIWLIRTSLLRNQRHWTHLLCWSKQRWFDSSEHPFWEIRDTGLTSYVGPSKGDLTDQNIPSVEIRGTGLTHYVGPCKGDLTDQNIPSEKSEALDSPAMLVHAKVIWLIRTSLLWKSEALDSPTMLVHAKVIWLIRTSLLRNRRHWTHQLCWSMQRWFDWSEHPFCGN